MRILKNCLVLLLVVAICVGFCACGMKTDEIKSLTKSFENSCNKIDLNGMLDCINPDIASGIKAVTGFVGMFSDDDSDVILDKFAKMLFTGLPENSREFFSSIKISLDNVEIKEEQASALAKITYDISGEKYETQAVFEYAHIDGKWYISDFCIE